MFFLLLLRLISNRFHSFFAQMSDTTPNQHGMEINQQQSPVNEPRSTYKGRLIEETQHIYFDAWFVKLEQDDEEEDIKEDPAANNILIVQFSQEEIVRLHNKWKLTLIIRLQCKILTFQGLKEILQKLWKTQFDFQILDIESNFYLINFTDSSDNMTVLARGSWFLFNHYLAISRWRPYFKPANGKINNMII